MKLTFTEAAWKDYLWFQETDKKHSGDWSRKNVACCIEMVRFA